ncbi:magnesium transporter [Alkalispirochaeta odontotermitis]|nr:magnesium transporter [Alkalispirochaeta odontotermitis]CAB1075598.1 Magnesium and cobalt transport protein CorA [Olavius algarvensis Delta 1 endosymbiont]
MARFLKKREESKGLSPGSLVFIGNKKVENVRIRAIDYDGTQLIEDELKEIAQGAQFKGINTVTWINVDGLHDLKLMKEIGDTFDLHPLLLEDIPNTGQRPKLEEFDNCLFLVLKMLRYDEDKQMIISEQLSMVLGDTLLLTFQEQPGDVFEPVRERIRKKKARIRGSGIDYLAYALLDCVVENYVFIVERLGEQIEDLEEEVLENAEPAVLEKINTFKREMNFIRKSVRPARESIIQLAKLDTELINGQTVPFLKDLQDLITQAAEAIDTYRDMLSDQLNLYNSVMSNRMNEIMKVLTIFAAIFIPLTFIAGIYGTNFEYLPELKFKYSYYIFWGVMIGVAVTMLSYFRRKKWL